MSSQTLSEQQLIDLFSKLGLKDPHRWAASQMQEGIPQLARAAFLVKAWRLIDLVTSSIVGQMENPAKDNSPINAFLSNKLFKTEASNNDIAAFIKAVQARLLYSLCLLLDDPEAVSSEVRDVAWGVFQTDGDGNPVAPMSCLAESVFEIGP